MSRFVNRVQSPEERRAKYALLRGLGESVSVARKRRDWRWSKYARHYDLDKQGLLETAQSYNPNITIFDFDEEETNGD